MPAPMPKPFPRLAAVATLCLLAAGARASGVAVAVHDSTGTPLADAVAWLEAEAGQAVSKGALKTAEIEQKSLKFMPLVTVVQTGTRIDFPNNDKVRHHIYSFSPAHKFDQKLYSGTTATPQIFDKPGIVVLGCNIHDKMVAYVRIVDTPYLVKGDAAGVGRIDAPAGKYVLKVWHFNMAGGQPAEQAVVVKAGDALGTASFRLPMKPPVSGDAL
ncbi:methylamine utilization protein [Pseudoduganella aquatica]|uniref:methylamine utilization protein n=1 Tax=Pseudoduganella aquatica TaxID=2660641 RepID=UPI001E497D35|nr:methylamine utilization protein [Pseudoduganella aquatica]